MNDQLNQSNGSWRDGSCDRRDRRRHGPGSIIVGLAILAAGVILTLDNFGVLDAEDYFHYWPVLLILVGLSHILRPAPSRRLLSGLVWIGVGAVILLYRLDYITFDIWDLWPVLLVFIGLSMLTRGFRWRKREALGDSASTFSATAVMGSDVRKITAEDFRGGEATAIMGGCEIDLRGAGSSGGPAEIDCFAVWGGIEIWVPEDWEVQASGTALLAGFEDKTRSTGGAASKVLIVRGTAIMAGVEIKN